MEEPDNAGLETESCNFWGRGAVKPRYGVKGTRPGPTWLYSSMVGTAGPAAVGLQLVLVRIQVNWHGQFLTQYLQLSVEMILRVLEEAKHQQVCDVLSIQARAVADLG